MSEGPETGGVSATSLAASKALPALLLLYATASLLHFAHNAEYLTEYPNLPGWLSRARIYDAWFGIMGIGLLGLSLYHYGQRLGGLGVLALYAALGFDGLLHYGRAPYSAHSTAMNLTILLEVLSAALLLTAVIILMMERVWKPDRAGNRTD